MSDDRSLSVLIPIVFPFDHQWVNESLKDYINRKIDPIFLHVIDTRILDTLENSDIKDVSDIVSALKAGAEARLAELKQIKGLGHSSTMVVEGIPFLEIVKIGKDLKVDLIAMKIRSSHKNIEGLFIGSTSEHVVRGSSVPVLCLP